MPFGLKNATQTFKRFKDDIFSRIDLVFIYLDDILIHIKNKYDHLTHIRKVCEILESNWLIIDMEKCVFGIQELDFLGHGTKENIIYLSYAKVKAIQNFPHSEM